MIIEERESKTNKPLGITTFEVNNEDRLISVCLYVVLTNKSLVIVINLKINIDCEN